MTSQKKFQQHSEYEDYDLDGDGIVTDEELAHAKEINKTEADLRKQKAYHFWFSTAAYPKILNCVGSLQVPS